MSAECLAPDVLFDYYVNRPLELECNVILSSTESTSAVFIVEYLRVFGWTCALESIVYLPLFLFRKNGIRRSLITVLLVNLATHPLISFVFPRAGEAMGIGVAAAVVVKELFAPVVEAFVVRRATNLNWVESIAVSFTANLFSWWVGSALAERLF